MSRFIWPKASSVRVARALSGHSAIGLTAAALLYILSISGVLSVFHHELQRWEQPGAPEMGAIHPWAVQKAAEAVMRQQNEPTAHFFVHLPTDSLPRTVVTTDTQAVFVNADGDIAGPENHAWTQFVLDLHYYLHLPQTLGLTVVGFLGVLLLSLSISGFLAHPRVFRDAFAVRSDGNRRLTKADLHNRLSVWTAPFHISSATTGAVLGLASIVAYTIAEVDYRGDVEAVYAPVFGDEPAHNDAPAALPNIATALETMAAEKPAAKATYVILHEPMTQGQHLQILGEHDRRLIFGDYYTFDADGTYTGNVGMSDGSAGQQIVASLYKLHFGSYGGLPIKLAYGFFGIVLAVIISAGVDVYLLRKRERGHAMHRLEAIWSAIVWGTPAALALTLAVALLSGGAGGTLATVFWITLVLAVVAAAMMADRTLVARAARAMTGILIIVCLAYHLAVHAESFGSPAALGVAFVGLLIGAAFLLPEAVKVISGTKKPNVAPPHTHPAE